MTNMNDNIFNRESRTAFTLPKVDRRSTSSCVQSEKSFEICENCDKSQNKFTQIPQLKIKLINNLKFSKNLLTLTLSICIVLLLTAQSEAKPTHSNHHHNHPNYHSHHHHHHHSHNHKQRSLENMGEVNIFDFQCPFKVDDHKSDNPMKDDVLTSRLNAILLGCKDTLAQTKNLTDQYIKAMWSNATVEAHHDLWRDRQLTWIHPNNVPLQKEFNESIKGEHLQELESVDWKNHERVFEYIGKIYQRLERVYVGIQIVKKWIEVASSENKMDTWNATSLEKSRLLFYKVADDIQGLLCQIRALFLEVSIQHPKSDIDITPINEEMHMHDQIKLNHWIIYREYQNLIEYSRDLLNLIVEKYNTS